MKLENSVVIGEELALSWDDGEETFIRLNDLRKACPCAACQGEPDVRGEVVRPKVSWVENSFVLRRYDLVGGYAIQFFWADGHGTGIFSFPYLRKLGVGE